MTMRTMPTALAPALVALLLAALQLAAVLAALLAATEAGAITAASIEMSAGRSQVITLDRDAGRVAVADPAVADILLLSPRQIYVTAKAPGLTNITTWSGNQVALVMDLVVSPDVTRLKELLHRMLPAEQGIRVMAAHDALTISGTVTSAKAMATALDLARLFAPAGDTDKVVNLMGVGGSHQVLLEVKVAEMSRSVMERLGIDLSYFSGGQFAYTLLNNLFTLDGQGPLALDPWGDTAASAGAMTINPSRNGMFRLHRGSAVITGFLDMLKQNGLVKILAEPTLICRSGEDAQFLAGGEIPIPVPQGLGATAIEYKPFGVALSFTPVVLDNNRISLKVFPEVSELDYSNAVTFSGFTIPAITSRRASTTVELGDGQSFAVAGLLKDNVRENVDKYPVLGDIPILGALFSSKEFQKAKTELVIIITPHLAKPLDMAAQSLPTDDFIEPSEAEFFLFGRMEGKASEAAPVRRASTTDTEGPASGLDGAFGHDRPQGHRP